MQDRNGYFKIIDGEDTVSMRYYPPVGNGEKLNIDEVTDFFERVGIYDYDSVKVNKIISAEEETEEIISTDGCFRFDEIMDINITADKMCAIARFYPCSSNGSRMKKRELLRTIESYKITFGIDMEAIEAFLETPEYCKDIIVARGEKPIEGSDAYITYNFQTDRKAKPQLNEDGTVDFHNLNNISNVQAGDVLAVLTREDPGVPGTDVFGNIAKPNKVKRLTLKCGNNIEITEDGLKLISQTDGHAILEQDKVFVSGNYDVPADVDTSTGDIVYNGSVTVKGNVRTGFAIQADGDVEVFGVVEGAKITAGGNIILHRGIQGMGRSDIYAKGNIVSRFIEGADIKVEGYVETDTIINSNISAKGDVFVRGRNASLIGGHVRSTTLIEAAVIGSSMGTATIIEVGTDPAIRDKVMEYKERIEDKNAENTKIQQMLTVMRKKRDMGTLENEKVPMLSQMTKNLLLNTADIKAAETEVEKLEKLLRENTNAKIRATKAVHPGTKVIVAGDYIQIHQELKRCEFKKVRGEIKAVSL